MHSSLHNYICTERRRVELSQGDLGFLANLKGSTVSRHECFKKAPTLETALRYAVIFDTDLRGLFAGLFEEAQREVQQQARRLQKDREANKEESIHAHLAVLANDTDDVYYVAEQDDTWR